MFRLIMRLVPFILGLAAAGSAWLVTRPEGFYSLGNSPRRSAALAAIAFVVVSLLTWLPGFFYDRARRKSEAALSVPDDADDDDATAFGPLPPIRPTAVTDARAPYVPKFADDPETDSSGAPTAAAPASAAFAWPTMTASELGQAEPELEPEPEPAQPAAPAPEPQPVQVTAEAPVAASESPAPAAVAPIDELLMRRKADLAAALQRVSKPLADAPQPVATPAPAQSDASQPASPKDTAASAIMAAVMAPMPPHRPVQGGRPAVPLPDMRARIAAIRRDLD